MHNKKVLNSVGNMTNVEKELNKADLNAYKVYDDANYAMMPGTQPAAKPEGSPEKKTSPINRNGKGAAILNEDKLHKHEDRLQHYGLLDVNRPRNARRNGDPTLERSIEFSTNPLPEGAPVPVNSMPSRAEMAGIQSSLYHSQNQRHNI